MQGDEEKVHEKQKKRANSAGSDRSLPRPNPFADADKDVRALKIRLAALAIEKAQRQAKEKR